MTSDNQWLRPLTGNMPHVFGDGVERAPGEEADPTAIKKGALSTNEVNVIVLGDVDMASDMFANMYRNIDERNYNGTQASPVWAGERTISW